MQAGNLNHISWTNPSHLSNLLDEYQQVRFDLFHGGYPYCGEFVTLAKNLPNVYPDLCWLHIISPGAAKHATEGVSVDGRLGQGLLPGIEVAPEATSSSF